MISEDPFRDFNHLTNHFNPFVSSTVSISPTAIVGNNTHIQPNVFIGNHVRIGKNCVIHPNVTIYDHCVIGDAVVLHAGCVLGADAFYYKNRATGYDKLLSGGRVVLEDEVELGALCTIDRGVSGDTRIQTGTKIDNQVHVGHDTVIGKKCLIASQTGIAGCVVIEDEVTIWGQVGTTSGIRIGKGSRHSRPNRGDQIGRWRKILFRNSRHRVQRKAKGNCRIEKDFKQSKKMTIFLTLNGEHACTC